MAYITRPRIGYSYSGAFPQGVKWLLISNIALFVLYYFAVLTNLSWVFHPLGLVPGDVLRRLSLWQLVTYMFLHDPYGFLHILFNMLTLYMFGADLERTWGTRAFLKYYFLCGVGAGICVVLANLIIPTGSLETRTIGASGAIYGLLLAFGMMFPETQILFMFIFPLKAKYFVMILGAIAFMSTVGASGSGVSHVAHLGGMIFGFLYLKSRKYGRLSVVAPVSAWYKDWKVRRARRKFQVYLRKRESDRDRWVH